MLHGEGFGQMDSVDIIRVSHEDLKELKKRLFYLLSKSNKGGAQKMYESLQKNGEMDEDFSEKLQKLYIQELDNLSHE